VTQQLSLPDVEGCEAVQVATARQRTAETTVEKRARELAHQMFKEWQEEYHPPVSALPAKERPTNRMISYGAGALSTTEILAIILGGPQQLYQASTLLAKFDGLTGLARANFHELSTTVKGVSSSRSARIQAALELGRRLMTTFPDDRPQVKSPADAANLLMLEMSLLEQEHLRTILLDSKNRVLATPTIYVGSLNTSVVRVGELFREAIRLNCAALIVAHNHPSGDPTPSPEDVKVTGLIVQAGQLVDIEVLDHIILGQQRYVSLKERGLGFN
jgi:DNA repair protein RadC